MPTYFFRHTRANKDPEPQSNWPIRKVMITDVEFNPSENRSDNGKISQHELLPSICFGDSNVQPNIEEYLPVNCDKVPCF